MPAPIKQLINQRVPPPYVWITQCAEMGHLLIPELRALDFDVVALDLVDLPDSIKTQCNETVVGSVLDADALGEVFLEHTPTHVFHLAAVLSRKAELDPDLAHRVNVDGTYNLFKLCDQPYAAEPIRFLFPSSIAVYGLPSATVKKEAGALKETEWTVPDGVYGCAKLYCELFGAHLQRSKGRPDFRAIRFPGLISADTLPTGGTTDYAPEMIHAAAQGKPYGCFVLRDTRLPFMTMPDGVDALIKLALADPHGLSRRTYNIRGFSSSAAEIRSEVLKHFPDAQIGFEPDPARQALVDSWPADVDDSAAQKDWGFSPRHGKDRLLHSSVYTIPADTPSDALFSNEGHFDHHETTLEDANAFFPISILHDLVEEVRSLAWENAGILREASGLEQAVAAFKKIGVHLTRQTTGLVFSGATRTSLEASNMTTVAELVARCALAREESRGAHYRTDHPEKDDACFGGSSFIRKRDVGVAFESGVAIPGAG